MPDSELSSSIIEAIVFPTCHPLKLLFLDVLDDLLVVIDSLGLPKAILRNPTSIPSPFSGYPGVNSGCVSGGDSNTLFSTFLSIAF
ncbi:hypothetical protein Fmac_026126 [Flemingia macrophylla]|uniref:Uncharacterized protein n=1 Tax=Flemingia macrophylla TaxID=520843 RepID=A0ABD1LDZ3_9FABA